MLIDVVASNKKGTGACLLLQAIIMANKAKKTGILSIGVTKGGRSLLNSFGFETSHSWREKGSQRYQRNICYSRIQDVHMSDLNNRLRVPTSLLTDVCFRNGLTPKSMHNLVGRC